MTPNVAEKEFYTPSAAVRRLATFVREHALPLWASSGFDEKARCFQERLAFDGLPQRNIPRRAMVQARQIVTYARSSLSGWYGGSPFALDAFESACKLYRSPDGNPGWVFSLHPDGSIADPTRDLYSHAFLIYMFAWIYRLTGDRDVLALADATLADIDIIFGVGKEPGFVSRVPGSRDLREQNPHMHLFEGLLSLAEVSGAERYISRASALITLFDDVLADPVSGAVREQFSASWRPLKSDGKNPIEPGHQMEWSWLLREWERLTGASVQGRVNRLISHATRFGIDASRGLVRGVVLEDGEPVSTASRVWPQTEAIRALCREDSAGLRWPGLVAAITNNLFETHLPAHLRGGWIDQIGENGKATVDYMPASTLYHLVGAALDSVRSLEAVR
jgi:mannose-6-phosphate isomerase